MASKKKNTVGGATVGGKKQEYTSEISTLSAENENLEATPSEGTEAVASSDEGTPKTLASASYSPKTWIEGEVIYDDDLNHMEEGIKNNSDDIAELNADLTDKIYKAIFSDYGERIPANSDLNDYQTAGKFYCSSGSDAATITNNPNTGNGFTLYVFQQAASSSARYQILTSSSSSGIIFFRFVNGSTTGSWKQIATNDVSTNSVGEPVILTESGEKPIDFGDSED